jgi:hypothetical protein
MRLEVAETVVAPAVVGGDSLFLGSLAGRQEPLLGSEGHTVLPTKEGSRNRESDKKQKEGT